MGENIDFNFLKKLCSKNNGMIFTNLLFRQKHFQSITKNHPMTNYPIIQLSNYPITNFSSLETCNSKLKI